MCSCSLLLSPPKASLGSAVIPPEPSRRERSRVERHRNFEGINRWRCAEKEIAKVNGTEKLARLMRNYNDGWTQTDRLETPIKAITSQCLFVRSGEPGLQSKCQAVRRAATPCCWVRMRRSRGGIECELLLLLMWFTRIKRSAPVFAEYRRQR